MRGSTFAAFIGSLAVILSIAGAGWTLAPSPATAQQTGSGDRSLEVTGFAEISVPANRARLVFAVETEGGSAEEASQENARRMRGALDSVREAGGPALVVETFGYQLQPRYQRPAGDPRGEAAIVGYRAQNQIRATTDEPDAVGRLIDAAVSGGANRVTSLQFDLRSPTAARNEALREAVARAREEAEVIAEALEVSLGTPLEVRGGAQDPGSRHVSLRDFAVQMEQFETPVEPGPRTVSASVTIRYRLEDPR